MKKLIPFFAVLVLFSCSTKFEFTIGKPKTAEKEIIKSEPDFKKTGSIISVNKLKDGSFSIEHSVDTEEMTPEEFMALIENYITGFKKPILKNQEIKL